MERRLRTYWLLRERYRRAANFATLMGALFGLSFVVAATLEATDRIDAPTLVAAGLVVMTAALLPRFIVRGVWRLQRGRSRERLG